MRTICTILLLMILAVSAYAQKKVSCVATSQTGQWQVQPDITTLPAAGAADVEILLDNPQQTIEGFGTCFNELGWTSLSILNARDRESILRELFAPGVGANFTVCRMPVGANDFSLGWYSYDEQDGDFDMKHFSINHDLQTLVPFIQSAQKYNPALKLWASPWSPPSWMKYNRHYAAKSLQGSAFKSDEYGIDFTGISNGLKPGQEGREGTDMFIQQDKYFKAYALYFARFIEAYKRRNINIGMVMPQNEFNSAQVFPSCTWTAAGLAKFIRYLGPQMQSLHVKVFLGTVERANDKLVDSILTDPKCSGYLAGVGFQWAGKGAIPAVHQHYPNLALYQSEQECGNGKNDWNYCKYTWELMKHYLTNGASAYMYWNTSLKQGGISSWGWKQNSLVSVDTVNKTYKYNYEYYLLKHLSHFVKPGAKRLNISGSFSNILAFLNPDKSVAIIMQNETDTDQKIRIKLGNQTIDPTLRPDTFYTFLIQ